jgi:predicted anti-sigma-YlaC factor YlaD
MSDNSAPKESAAEQFRKIGNHQAETPEEKEWYSKMADAADEHERAATAYRQAIENEKTKLEGDRRTNLKIARSSRTAAWIGVGVAVVSLIIAIIALAAG